ncbi:MAG TPA: EAL domain-containing protein [Kineosporiaceae bacterium]|nr:EAL domain-containing protein [Kineosporiaceae bacterium]
MHTSTGPSSAPGVNPVESLTLLAAARRLTRLALWEWELETGRLTWSPELCEILGREIGDAPMIREWESWLHPDDRDAAALAESEGLRTGRGWTIELRVTPPDGRLRHLRVWCDPLPGPDGRPAQVIGAVLDQTEQAQNLAALEGSREELRMAFDDAPIGMLLMRVRPGERPRVIRRNRALFALFGGSPDEPAGALLDELLSAEKLQMAPDALARTEAFLAGLIAGQVAGTTSTQLQVVTGDGRGLDLWVHAAVTESRWPQERLVMLHFLDVTPHLRAERQLATLALTDPITGVANRSRFQQALGELLSGVVPGRRAVGLLLLDLDRFKLVNDSLGHVTGDLLLTEVAQRLLTFAHTSWLVCRLGGDEFAVLIDDAPDGHQLGRIARQLGDTLALPYSLPGDVSIVCTASIGVARCDDQHHNAEDLYREADLALYAAKDTGRDTWALFDGRLRARTDQRIEAERRLRTALARDGIRGHLQPVVDLSSGRPVAAEALARLEHPDLGLLQPCEFIQVAEDTGLVVHVDARLTELAVAHLARPDVPASLLMAVNLSASSLDHAEYLERLTAALDRHQVDPSRLLIEVTESSLLDASGPRAQGLADLRQLGIQIGIDDFGTGYSALAYLDRFQLDFLKIDRSFVARLGTGERADTIVAAIVSLAHAHGLVVTAEGVEYPAQAQRLREMGCDRAQGFLFGRPAPAR